MQINSYKYLVILFGWMIAFQSAGLAQNDHWHFEQWGSPQNDAYIESIAEDRWGNIWIGTKHGVYRLDGYEFTPLNEIISDPEMPVDLFVGEMYFDDKDKLWIASYRNGLYSFDPHSVSFKHIKNRLVDSVSVPGNRVYGLHQGADNHLVISMHAEGLAKYDEKSDSFELIIPFDDKKALIEKRNFQLMLKPVLGRNGKPVSNWYSTLTSLVQYIPDQDTFLYHHPEGKYAFNMEARYAMQNTDGKYWVATYSSGLWSFDAQKNIWKNHRTDKGPDEYQNALNIPNFEFLDDQHVIVSGANTGLVILNTETDVFTHLIKESGNDEPSVIIRDFYWDSRGILWIATGRGLYSYNPQNQQFAKKYIDGYIVDVLSDPVDKTRYVLEYHHLYVYSPDGKVDKVKIPAPYDKSDGSTGLAFDSKGTLWIGTEYGLLRYNKTLTKTEHVLPQKAMKVLLEHTYYRSFQIDHNDKAWLGSQEGTIARIDLESLTVRTFDKDLDNATTLQHNYITEGHCIDVKGNVWFRGESGISYYDQEKQVFSNSPDIFLASDSTIIRGIHSIAPSPQGDMFFGSKLNAIYTIPLEPLETVVPKKISTVSSLPDYRINKMLFDDKGKLWMSAEEGIACVDFKNNASQFYGVSDGIVSANNFILDTNGELMVTTTGGYYHFYPDNITPYRMVPKIVMRDFNVFDKAYLNHDGKKLQNGDVAELTYRQNFFSFAFANVTYQSKKKWKYAYMLEGLDEQWVESGYRDYAAYTNVAAGDYIFKVKANHPDFPDWTAPVEFLHIRIHPPFWNTNWFIMASLLVLISIIYSVYRYRMRQMRSKQELIIAFNKQIAETEMKALRAQMNPHFLFNVLNAIKLNVQKNKQDNAIDFITSFSKLIRSVLQNSEKKLITLREELDALELYIGIEQRRFNTEFKYTIDIDRSIDANQVLIPPLLLQPYVENAIWHGLMHKTDGVGILSITASKKDGVVSIAMTDNGIGRKKAAQLRSKSAVKKKSMGMQITSDRVKLAEQAIAVVVEDLYDNGTASGTRVTVSLS